MPSTPGEDSPFPESQLKRSGQVPNLPGGPSTAGKAGGVQAGRFSFPNPPAPNTAQPGRPPESTGPVPGVVPPAAPSPTAPGTGSLSQQEPQTKDQPVPQQEEQSGEAARGTQAIDPATGQPVDQGGLMGQQQLSLSRMPRPGEVPPGTTVQTPFGTVEDDGTGTSSMALSPEGTQKYKEAKAALRKKLGAMPAGLDLPGMPEFPIELGQWNFNPFTGKQERG